MFKMPIITTALFLSFFSSSVLADKANWQQVFNRVPSITAEQMNQEQDKIVLVDVRSRFFAEQNPVAGAEHISFSSRMFTLQMQALREANQGKTIVIYCNSDNCIRSYRAVEKCQNENIDNVVIFDLYKDMQRVEQRNMVSQI